MTSFEFQPMKKFQFFFIKESFRFDEKKNRY